MNVHDLPVQQLEAHPNQFMFHDIQGAEWDELVSDVRERGIQQPITVSRRTGAWIIVDGHQRVRAVRELGLPSIPAVEQVFEDEQAETLALVMANIRRRHLSREERRAVIAEMLKLYPEKSNRQHAEILGVDHKTVKVQREVMEGRGEIPHVANHIDTLGRKQPAAKPQQESEALGEISQVDRIVTAGGKSRPVSQVPSRPKQAVEATGEFPQLGAEDQPASLRQPVVDVPTPPIPNLAAQRLAENMARNNYEPTRPPTPKVEPDWRSGLPLEAIHAEDKTDEEHAADARAMGWSPPEPGARSLSDPIISNRADSLRKTLAQLLKFRGEGRELLDEPGAQVLNVELLVFYAHEMLGEWLEGTKARTADEQAKTIDVQALN